MTNEKRVDAGFLHTLLADTAGNVLMLTAAATIPMLGVIGGAVDISRVYLVKSRVQAACDSAVLAGRKAMSTNTYTTAAQNRANSMFNFNFQDADYGTTSTNFTSAANAQGVVSGTATTTVPMVLMNIVGVTPTALSVTCSADIQIPNIDIVMVLDVTGSMNQCADGYCSSGEDKKIDSLKKAAKDFYTTLQTAMLGNTTSQVRYGFVPYDEAVNGLDVFKSSPNASIGELPLTHFADTMVVQSREANFNTPVVEWIPDPNETPTSFTQIFEKDASNPNPKDFVAPRSGSVSSTPMSNSDCQRYGSNLMFNISNIGSSGLNVTLLPRTWYSDGNGDSVLYQRDGAGGWLTSEPTDSSNYYYRRTFERVSPTWGSGSFNACERRVVTTKYIKRTRYKFTSWNLKPITYDVSAYKTGAGLTYLSSINTSAVVETQGTYDLVQMASMGVGSTDTTTWNGCIEERETTAVATFTPIPTAAYDLNFIDGGTTGSAALFKWRPTLAALTYDRERSSNRMGISNSSASGYGRPAQGCPNARMKSLNVMSQTDFNTYIDTLSPGGNTYLDVGMVWGLRLIAAQGMFAHRNLTGPNGGQISRHIIFLTDGEPVSNDSRYTAYGVEQMGERITGSTGVGQSTLHARRFQALCDAHRGAVSIWAIGLGSGVTPNLSQCADPGRSFQADNTTELRDAFRAIAQDIADLRLIQ